MTWFAEQNRSAALSHELTVNMAVEGGGAGVDVHVIGQG
jgi:hypothetical protein